MGLVEYTKLSENIFPHRFIILRDRAQASCIVKKPIYMPYQECYISADRINSHIVQKLYYSLSTQNIF